ncbi:uncharacterized protein [Zea mays]|nr:uncharacterized protein LOC103637373 [Zea mays]|eukprot:XP_020398765.1 uncharacterized protein LOC103637373 [Zea mays]
MPAARNRSVLSQGSQSYKSVKVAAKRLEKAALSYKGDERVQLLRRWLVVLKETQRATTVVREPQLGDNPDQTAPLLDLYIDYDSGAEPMNFFHVFLYSQALECVVLSLIREAPTEEEVSLVSEVFGMCLSGGKDVHNALLSSVKDLARLFSSYSDEVLAKRDELLQFAQGAISGQKINADIARFCLFCWAVEGVCSSIFVCPCLHALKTKASFFLIPD